MKCRHCHHSLDLSLVDLDYMPPSNAYLSSSDDFAKEKKYPLKVLVCQHCWLVQTEDFTRADELFTADYAYFSSTSTSWLHHAACYAKKAIEELKLNSSSFVIELAANDGYLLRNFQQAGIPNLGIEPTTATAEAARSLGLTIISAFFGRTLAAEIVRDYRRADLVIANNVLAHVPDINDFVSGISLLLAQQGVCSFEFPHLLNLLNEHQFDTIYHEHYSYLSLLSVQKILQHSGLKLYDVEQLSTHGGSLRVWACLEQNPRQVNSNVKRILQQEIDFGLATSDIYRGFQLEVDKVAAELKLFLQQQQRAGVKVVAYGAAAKGNTLLNYAAVGTDLLSVVFDAAPSKQGKYLPGSHIPIQSPVHFNQYAPDMVLILPWNIKDEVIRYVKSIADKPCAFVTAIPELTVIPA
jgi:SAM-dependent methyltransferase